MIHKACMPVYMNSGKIVADGRDGTGRVGKSKVLQEVLADLKTPEPRFPRKIMPDTYLVYGTRGKR